MPSPLRYVVRAWVKCPEKQNRLILKEECKKCEHRKECKPETVRRATKVKNNRYFGEQNEEDSGSAEEV